MGYGGKKNINLKKYLTFKIKFITFILTSEFLQIEYKLYFHQREH